MYVHAPSEYFETFRLLFNEARRVDADPYFAHCTFSLYDRHRRLSNLVSYRTKKAKRLRIDTIRRALQVLHCKKKKDAGNMNLTLRVRAHH